MKNDFISINSKPEAINKFKEYKDRLSAFEGNYYVPSVVDKFCVEVYNADDYYSFNIK